MSRYAIAKSAIGPAPEAVITKNSRVERGGGCVCVWGGGLYYIIS